MYKSNLMKIINNIIVYLMTKKQEMKNYLN